MRWSYSRLKIVLPLLLALPAPSYAAIGVQDGFEDGTLSPWFQDASYSSGTDWFVTSSAAHSGTYSAEDTGNKLLKINFAGINVSSISSLSFWLQHPDLVGAPAALEFYYSDNSTGSGFITTTTTAWQFFDVTSSLTAGKTLTGFGLYGYNGSSPNRTRLDDFTINTIAGVPEPSTWAMMLLGFGAIGASMRRRRWVSATGQMA
nr:PEPxxWA-CTERM sorting domain-containing protein [uncultured Sphingomonas sp.]